MYTSKEEAKKIALGVIKNEVTIFHVTDDVSKMTVNAIGLPSECWYIIYSNSINEITILESSNIIAVSKADGRVMYIGSTNDEG